MAKLVAAVAVVFAVGAGAMTVLGGFMGAAAEAAALGLVGAGLVGTGHALAGSKLAPRSTGEAAPKRVGGTA